MCNIKTKTGIYTYTNYILKIIYINIKNIYIKNIYIYIFIYYIH